MSDQTLPTSAAEKVTAISNDVADGMQVEQEEWLEAIGAGPTCANCGAERQGNFCADCGQKHLKDRLKFGALLKDLFSKLTDFDRGLFRTIADMMIRPGTVARSYVSGKQRPYINPLTYFFIGAALQIVSFWLVQDIIQKSISVQMVANPAFATDDFAKIEQKLGQPIGDILADSYISAIQQAYTYAALLFFCLPFSVMLWALHRAVGENHRLGETTIFSLYTFGHILMITALFTPFTVRAGTNWQMIMGIAAYLLFPLHAHTNFFRSTALSRLMTVLSTLSAMVPFFISIICIFIGSFVLKIVMAG